MLILYTKDGCQHCSLVKQELAKIDIPYEERNVADSKNAETLISQGGKMQTPFLMDEETGISMYESMVIMDYLRKIYT